MSCMITYANSTPHHSLLLVNIYFPSVYELYLSIPYKRSASNTNCLKLITSNTAVYIDLLHHAMIDMLNLWAQDKVNANCCITHLNVVILLTSHLLEHLQP